MDWNALQYAVWETFLVLAGAGILAAPALLAVNALLGDWGERGW